VDAHAAADDWRMRGRRSRVVLAPRRRAKVRETLDKRFAGDGGKKALSPGRARSKPLEPLRGQGRTISAEPVVLPRAFYCTRTMGAAGTRHSLRPLYLDGGGLRQKLGHLVPRERDFSSPSAVMPRFKRGIQYSRGVRV